MGYRYLIEIDIDTEKFEAEEHQPRHISRVVGSFEGVKIISLSAKPCPICNPPSKGGCRCGQSNFVESD